VTREYEIEHINSGKVILRTHATTARGAIRKARRHVHANLRSYLEEQPTGSMELELIASRADESCYEDWAYGTVRLSLVEVPRP